MTFEVFIAILRRAIAHHEVVLRVVRRTSPRNLPIARSRTLSKRNESRRHPLRRRLPRRNDSSPRLKHRRQNQKLFSLEENDLALITCAQNRRQMLAPVSNTCFTPPSKKRRIYESHERLVDGIQGERPNPRLFRAKHHPPARLPLLQERRHAELPEKFYYSAHSVGTALRRTDPRSADVWMNLPSAALSILRSRRRRSSTPAQSPPSVERSPQDVRALLRQPATSGSSTSSLFGTEKRRGRVLASRAVRRLEQLLPRHRTRDPRPGKQSPDVRRGR